MKKYTGVWSLFMVALIGSSFLPHPQKSPVHAAKTRTWKVDIAHSYVKFTVGYMMISEVEGYFKVFSGTMEQTQNDFTDAKIYFTTDVNSINTNHETRDKHLRSDDFFSAEKYPLMTFVGNSFKSVGNMRYVLKGNLTIRDVTKPVNFDVTYGGIATNHQGDKAGFKAKAVINRFDYNLKWNSLLESGGMLVGENIEITVLIKMDEVAK
jgi:polyisoprenoid-binding protein YceI